MIKVEDLITASYSRIVIMDNSFEVLIIDACRMKKSYLFKELLDREVERLESRDNYIRVWLKENENGRSSSCGMESR